MISSGKVGVRSDGDYDFIAFELVCDCCNQPSWNVCTSFKQCLEYKKNEAKEEGWRCVKTETGWKDICPDCRKKGVRV